MKKAELENRSQTQSLQGELASSRGRNSELERRVSETEEQIALLRGQVAETEMRLALLKGEQDATCVDAYQLGVEETRSKISKEHPEWDLSFLDVETFEACSPGDEEDEYIDVSDTDLDVVPDVSVAAAPEGHTRHTTGGTTVFEKGETSQAPPNVTEEAAEAAGAVPNPDS